MTVDRATVEALSQLLRAAEATGVAVEPITGVIPAGDIDTAYEVQSLSVEAWTAAGRRIVGRKIGLTNPKVQAQLGVDQPDFGVLFADMAVPDGGNMSVGAVLQPRVEAELAFVLQSDLDVSQPTAEEVAAAVGAVAPAIEIVGSRISGWRIGIVDTVADNGSSAAFVLGDNRSAIADVDLVGCSMTMTRTTDGGDSEVVSSGTGADCLGSPLIAATWLAGELASRGNPLRAGDVILTGALGPMVDVIAGNRYSAEISGVGNVTVAFSHE